MSGVAKWMNVITSADSKDVKDVEIISNERFTPLTTFSYMVCITIPKH
jgi:hypothetical protein